MPGWRTLVTANDALVSSVTFDYNGSWMFATSVSVVHAEKPQLQNQIPSIYAYSGKNINLQVQ